MDGLVKIELGCGTTKTDGYLGIDRFPLVGVDIIADLNKEIPMENDSVDVVFASHSLEHFDDIQLIMKEINRVCKHGAILYVLAPYQMTSLNIGNYYHKVAFNEDTFRFLSTESEVGIDSEEYYNPSSPYWGLEQSDNSQATIEFKILGMEFFYYKEYAHLSDEVKRHARRSLNNVCDQLFYTLVVNKSNQSFAKDELEEIIKKAKIGEPPKIAAIRNMFQNQIAGKSLLNDICDPINAELNTQINETTELLNNEIKNLKESHNKQINSLKGELKLLNREIKNQQSEANKELKCINSKVDALEMKNDSILALCMELIQKAENKNKLKRRFCRFNTNNDMFNDLQLNHGTFMSNLLIKNDKFNKNSFITLSRIVSFSNYIEYECLGNGTLVHFFMIASYGSKIFMEVVQSHCIIKQEIIDSTYEGEYVVDVGVVEGNLKIRFKCLDNLSIVRVLEIANRNKYFFAKSSLAAYID